MTEEDEVLWAKLKGNWDNANYRRNLVRGGRCLRTLAHDENMAVRNAARTELLKQAMDKINIR